MSREPAEGTPLAQLTEFEVIARGEAAIRRAVAAGRGTIGWTIQWAAYDACSAELAGRAMKWTSTATREQIDGMRAILAAAGFTR